MASERENLIETVHTTVDAFLPLKASDLPEKTPPGLQAPQWTDVRLSVAEILTWTSDLAAYSHAFNALTIQQLRDLKSILPQALETIRPLFNEEERQGDLRRRWAHDQERVQFLKSIESRHEQIIQVTSAPLVLLSLRDPQMRAELGAAKGLVTDIEQQRKVAREEAEQQKEDFLSLYAEADTRSPDACFHA